MQLALWVPLFAAALFSSASGATLKTDQAVTIDAQGRSKSKTKMMLTQLQAMSDKKEKMGLVPSEMAEAEEVKAALVNNILPAILQAADDRQEDLDMLFQDILDCQMEVAKGLHTVVQLESAVHTWEENVTTCVEEEVHVVGDKVKVCEEFSTMKKELKFPTDFPEQTALPEQVENYLRTMHEYFCGFWHEYEHKWEECRYEQKNGTNITEVCTTTQEEFEKAICTANIERKRTCTAYDTCYDDAVAKYNAKVQEIKDHLADLMEEYEAAVKILCLWDAWQLSCSPCTVDEKRVELCWAQQTNVTLVNITYEPPPPPIECPMVPPDAEPEDTPCTEAFIAKHYAPWAQEDEVLGRMKATCHECFGMDDIVTAGPAKTTTPMMAR
mmetsp:Transcript_23597/g.54938  ORF Transcript_23597/g.54938 Transcript_23597/m.54938 type:complete len:384 (+) Transcript_23597:82-1233(+)|eukprot:CAMPEP_0178431090 /NCGR_PEP_ID=MMETSP0689_2-20121128/31659_1 /TAXON_ID=160604 /ORGANISM="Amphidinium massartii, Strain CS-259" /LENGTH=383 /DNA_ID=CAMNT_0020052973 /DNA_START=46 /DNA_END=1197 /DNA_ORIENTATION=+